MTSIIKNFFYGLVLTSSCFAVHVNNPASASVVDTAPIDAAVEATPLPANITTTYAGIDNTRVNKTYNESPAPITGNSPPNSALPASRTRIRIRYRVRNRKGRLLAGAIWYKAMRTFHHYGGHSSSRYVHFEMEDYAPEEETKKAAKAAKFKAEKAAKLKAKKAPREAAKAEVEKWEEAIKKKKAEVTITLPARKAKAKRLAKLEVRLKKAKNSLNTPTKKATPTKALTKKAIGAKKLRRVMNVALVEISKLRAESQPNFEKIQEILGNVREMEVALFLHNQPRTQRSYRRAFKHVNDKCCKVLIKGGHALTMDDAQNIVNKVISCELGGEVARVISGTKFGLWMEAYGMFQRVFRAEGGDLPMPEGVEVPVVVVDASKLDAKPRRPHLLMAAIIAICPLLMGADGAIPEVATAMSSIGLTLSNILNTGTRKREKASEGRDRFYAQTVKSAKSSEWTVFSKLRFARTGKGAPITNGGAHSTDAQKGRAVRIFQDSIGGAYCPKVKEFAKMLGIDLTVDNCLRFEIDDQMDEQLKADVVAILKAAGFVVLCDGFAVHQSIARPFIKYGTEMFGDLVAVRGYYRSLITTPSLYTVNEDLPIFLGDLNKLLGWADNDGGAVHTNGLCIAMQFRGIAKVLEEKYRLLSKGITTNAKIVADITDGYNDITFVNYEGEEADKVKGEVSLNAKVKEVVGRAMDQKFNALAAVNAANNQQLEMIHGIGPATAAKIIQAREAAGGAFKDLDAFYSTSRRLDPKNPAALKVLRWSFGHKGRVYAVGLFLDKSCLKGRDKNEWDWNKGHHFGTNGQNVDFWSIAIDQIGGKISVGWQIVQLLDVDYVNGLFKNVDGTPGLAAIQLARQIDRALENEHSLCGSLLEALEEGGDDGADLLAAVKSISVLEGLGKTSSKRISNGLGSKAQSLYVQMIEMGGEYVITKTPKAKNGKGFKRYTPAFFGRTPNQGHETIRAPLALSPAYVGGFLRTYLDEGFEKVKEKHGEVASIFIQKLNTKCSHDAETVRQRCRMILTMLPCVVNGVALVDSTLQQMVCGDNDGDRNMISFSPMLVGIAKHITRKHPTTFPAREQSKEYVLNTFADVVTQDGGWLDAFDRWVDNDDGEDIAIANTFLAAPGNTPGQGNVGGTTQCAAAPLLFCKWHWVEKGGNWVYEPENPAARHLMNYLYLCQQIAIDRQKYYYLAPSLLYWFEADLEVGEAVIKQLMAGGGNDQEWLYSHYPIQGRPDMSFEEYKATWEDGALGEISEMIPGMGKGALGGESVAAMMYNNGPLYVWTAWQVNAINLGFPYWDKEKMEDLSVHFDTEEANVADWGAILKTLDLRDKLSAEELEEMWVWPHLITGWVKADFRKDQSHCPGTFQAARIGANNVWIQKMEDNGMESDPAETLVNSKLAEAFEEMAGDYKVEMKPWAQKILANVIYRSYVGESMAKAETMSQSARTQTDHHASGSDKLSHLKAALASREVDVNVGDLKALETIKDLRFLWVGALQNDKMKDEKRFQVLCSMMAFGINVIKACMEDLENDKASNMAHELIAALEQKSVSELRELIKPDAWKAWRDANDAQHSPSNAKENREAMDSVRKLLMREGFTHWLSEQSLKALTPEKIMTWLAMDGEDAQSKIIDFIGSDFFGALGEAWDRQELKEARNSVEVELREAIDFLKTLNIDADFEYNLESYARTEIERIRFEELAEQSGEKTEDDQLAWYSLNAGFFEREVGAITRPFTALIRLCKHQLDMFRYNVEQGVPTNDEIRDFWPAIEGALFGTHKELNEETDEWEEVTHVESRIAYELPIHHLAKMNLETLVAGYDVELLVDMIHKDRAFYEDEAGEIDYPEDSKEYYWTRKGYIHLSAIMTRMALEVHSESEMMTWLIAQFSGGVGHVTTSRHLAMAYGADEGRDHFAFITEEEYPPYYSGEDTVLAVQQTFESCYAETVTIEYLHDDHEETEQALQALENPDGHSEEDLDHYECYWKDYFVIEIYLPPLYGGRSNYDELYYGKYSEFYDDILVMTPYKLLRGYSFMMNGENQSQMKLPAVVKDFQNDAYGYTVGDSKGQWSDSQKKSRKRGSNTRKRNTELKNNMAKRCCEGWSWAGVKRPISSELDVDFNGSDTANNNFQDISARGYMNSNHSEKWKGAYSLVRFTASLLWSFANIMEPGPFQLINARSLAKVGASSIRSTCGTFLKPGFDEEVKSVEVKSLWMPEDRVKSLFRILAEEEEEEVGHDAIGGEGS